MTRPDDHKTKATAIKDSWGKRCNVLLFMSTTDDPSLPAIALNVTEGRDHLWEKTRQAFRYVWTNYKDQADWFFKADDDAYVVVENLRFMLSAYSSSDAIHFGYKSKGKIDGGHNHGGPGYVLSKQAVQRFVEQGLDNDALCDKTPTEFEDVAMTKCLKMLNVKNGDSRDSLGRERFSPLNARKQIYPGEPKADSWLALFFTNSIHIFVSAYFASII